MENKMQIIYNAVLKYASTIGNIKTDSHLIELCDFGDSYGFLFETEDNFANLYWCVEKETYKPYTFRPNIDIVKYKSRKILSTSIVR